MSAKLDGQLAKLHEQIAKQHGIFAAAVSAAVVETLAQFGLTVDDLTATKPTKETAKPPKVAKAAKAPKATKAIKPTKAAMKGKRQPAFKGPQAPKYRDPESGATWSGFGRAPAWIANAGNREVFLINGA